MGDWTSREKSSYVPTRTFVSKLLIANSALLLRFTSICLADMFIQMEYTGFTSSTLFFYHEIQCVLQSSLSHQAFCPQDSHTYLADSWMVLCLCILPLCWKVFFPQIGQPAVATSVWVSMCCCKESLYTNIFWQTKHTKGINSSCTCDCLLNELCLS